MHIIDSDQHRLHCGEFEFYRSELEGGYALAEIGDNVVGG